MMPNLELLFEHHGLVFWAVDIAVTILITTYPSIRDFLRGLPQGIKRAVRYQQEARLERLERYVEDNTRIFRLILGQVSVNVLIMSWWTVYAADRVFFSKSSGGDSMTNIIVRLFNQIGAIYVVITGLAEAMTFTAGLVLFTLWFFRDPQAQVQRLRESLGRGT
ncbi:MAG: hypothetical protein ABSG84_05300 [Acidobacteriaceae bacterium]|jgi:hypothetical protein